MNETKEMYSADELAVMCNCSEWKINRLIETGQLHSVSLGPRCVRVTLADWLAFVGSEAYSKFKTDCISAQESLKEVQK